MRKIAVEITGLRPYLQHKNPSTREEQKKMKELIKVLQKDPYNEEAFTTEAEISSYRTKEGVQYLPAIHLESSITKAGVSERVQGQSRKTYKDYMKAFVTVDPPKIPLEPQEYEIDRRWVKVQRSRVLRTRPMFDEGWKAKFSLLVLDNTIPVPVIEKIIRYAGNYVGIGDYRPKFGLFEVSHFKEMN